jgi:hypothetical protein
MAPRWLKKIVTVHLLARQVREFGGCEPRMEGALLLRQKLEELLHLPGKPAGVEEKHSRTGLADELLHLPHKAAGVVNGYKKSLW